MSEKLTIIGDHDENTILQMEIAASDHRVHHAVLCADGHKGYQVAIGGVLISKEHFAPATVGTIKTLHTLTPIGVSMAPKNVFDPFKD